jgi:hypothetical protein
MFDQSASSSISSSASDTQDPTTSVDNASSSSSISTEATSTEPQVAETATTTQDDNTFQNNFLEVMYTFDGVTWIPLGELNEISMKYRTFEIPVSATTSWGDMSHLQVKIVSKKHTEDTPTVYLDGIKVEVLYEAVIAHVHPDFSRDTVIKDESDDGVRVVDIINNDTGGREIWYTTLAEQAGYGVTPGSWVQIDFDQGDTVFELLKIYGRSVFLVDDVGKMLWVVDLEKSSNDGIAIIPPEGTSTIAASTTAFFTKPNGEEWVFEYNGGTKNFFTKIKSK